MIRLIWTVLSVCLVIGGSVATTSVPAQETTSSVVEPTPFSTKVVPYLTTYCRDCHNSEEAKGELDVTRFVSADDVVLDFREWKHILDFVRQGEMPPEDSSQPSVTESNEMIAAIEAILLVEAQKHAGDPGVILPRRLSNTEFDLSVRHLTGIDIRPTRDFPADPAGGEGFDNTGEALRMSPSLLKKYLGAAQHVADHLVLKPDGIFFAPFPVTSYNERKKLTEQAVIDFYESHRVQIGLYLEAAWHWRHAEPDLRSAGLSRWAESRGLSAAYMATVWDWVEQDDHESLLLQRLHEQWESLPPPTSDRDRPEALADFVRSFSLVHDKLHGD
ncbi:MAG: DUF1587 domain-containing protein, partial [Planctomycetales bacterium]|nr:DUF1587 domain-containing protein [Planctomycetales bacterium]